MFEFLDLDAVNIIFSAEVIFCAVFTICIFILVHALMTYLRQSGPLYTRIAQIEADLSVLQASIPVKIEQITDLHRSLEPLQEDFKSLRLYHAKLVYLERKAAEDEAEAERDEEEGHKKDVKRQKLGLERFL